MTRNSERNFQMQSILIFLNLKIWANWTNQRHFFLLMVIISCPNKRNLDFILKVLRKRKKLKDKSDYHGFLVRQSNLKSFSTTNIRTNSIRKLNFKCSQKRNKNLSIKFQSIMPKNNKIQTIQLI